MKPIGSLWSGRRGSNSRHPPWQGGILPLNYPRGYIHIIHAQFLIASDSYYICQFIFFVKFCNKKSFITKVFSKSADKTFVEL